MSIRRQVSRIFQRIDYETGNEVYDAEELVDEAQNILGYEEFEKTSAPGLGVPSIIPTSIIEEPVYEIVEDKGVRVNSRRPEAYESLEKAAERLEQ